MSRGTVEQRVAPWSLPFEQALRESFVDVRRRMCEEWLRRAELLEQRADALRAEGDTVAALDHEAAARDWREAVDALEYGGRR